MRSQRDSRFNSDIVELFLLDDQEIERLRALSSSGIIIIPPQGFIRQSIPPPFRPLHSRLQNVMNSHALRLWEAGQTLLIDLTRLDHSVISRLHFNDTHTGSQNQRIFPSPLRSLVFL